MTCFQCPKGNGKMCSGSCGKGCDDCPGLVVEQPQRLKSPALAKGLGYWAEQLRSEV